MSMVSAEGLEPFDPMIKVACSIVFVIIDYF